MSFYRIFRNRFHAQSTDVFPHFRANGSAGRACRLGPPMVRRRHAHPRRTHRLHPGRRVLRGRLGDDPRHPPAERAEAAAPARQDLSGALRGRLLRRGRLALRVGGAPAQRARRSQAFALELEQMVRHKLALAEEYPAAQRRGPEGGPEGAARMRIPAWPCAPSPSASSSRCVRRSCPSGETPTRTTSSCGRPVDMTTPQCVGVVTLRQGQAVVRARSRSGGQASAVRSR